MNRRDFLVGTAIAGGVSLAGPLAQAAAAAQTSDGPRKPVIDTHAHWYPPAWVDMVAKEGPKHGAKVGKNDKGYYTYSTTKFTAVFSPDFVDLSERLKAMDKQGVDIHALSLTSSDGVLGSSRPGTGAFASLQR